METLGLLPTPEAKNQMGYQVANGRKYPRLGSAISSLGDSPANLQSHVPDAITMTLSQQVCSLDLAKRLKELGVKQESLFFYKYKDDDKHYETKEYELCEEEGEFCHHDFRQESYISALTSAELGFLFKSQISKAFELCVDYEHTVWQDNEIEARAEIIIRGIESGLLTV